MNRSINERGARLALKKYSFRLPLRLASRLEALFEIHPDVKPSQVMRDVLSLGLDRVEDARSGASTGQPDFRPDTDQSIYLLTGPFSEFHGIVHKHRKALEHELFKGDLESTGTVDDYMLGYLE